MDGWISGWIGMNGYVNRKKKERAERGERVRRAG